MLDIVATSPTDVTEAAGCCTAVVSVPRFGRTHIGPRRKTSFRLTRLFAPITVLLKAAKYFWTIFQNICVWNKLFCITAHVLSSRVVEIWIISCCSLDIHHTDVCESTCLLLSDYVESGNFKCDDLIFGPKRKGITGGWSKLRSEELHGCTSQPYIKSRKVRKPGHMTCVGEKYMQSFRWRNLKERDHLEDLDTVWRLTSIKGF